MLFKAKKIKGYKLNSINGEIGSIRDCYFDDRHWAIRYLVVETGNWLTGRMVLISPHSLSHIDMETETIAVSLTKKQIEESPPYDSEKPVSKQYEDAYNNYYGIPMYWNGPYMWGPYPYISKKVMDVTGKPEKIEKTWESNLRSTSQVRGYFLKVNDGEIGHVDDFVIDEETWAIRYLIVDTRNWLPGKKVLLSPEWIDSVSWIESKVYVHLDKSVIKQSPDYTEDSMITRDYEAGLHLHYNKDGYWTESDKPKSH
ncbi:MAG: PRC-barrel domain-containing protein [Clostridia bacterium]|nr:PRC-barrel domain-containing protein [Clostridia bacterium]